MKLGCSSLPSLRNDYVVEWLAFLAETGETDLDNHCWDEEVYFVISKGS